MFELACPRCNSKLNIKEITCCEVCGAMYEQVPELDIPDLTPFEVRNNPLYKFEGSRYDRIAANGAKNYTGLAFTGEQVRAERAFGFVKNSGASDFVEIGPGFGTLQRLATGMPRLAIDYSIGFLSYLRQLNLEGLQLVRGVAEYLPLATGSVSCLVADGVFQSIVNREMFLCELGRICSTGARILVTIAYKWNYLRRPQNGFNILKPDEYETLGRFLNEVGFQIWYTWYNVDSGVVGSMEKGNYLYIEGTKQ